MAYRLQRRSFLQLALGTAAAFRPPRRSRACCGQRRRDHRLAERCADLGPQSALHARCAADLQGGLRPAARPGPAAQTHSASDQKLGPGARRLSMAVELRDDVDVPQRRQDDDRGFPLHLPRTHQVRRQARYRQFLAQGRGHRHRVADQGDDEIQFARRRPRRNGWRFSAAMSCRRNISRAGGLDELPEKAGRHRTLQARRIRAQFAHRARAQRQLLGAEGEDGTRHHPDHQGSVGARGGDPIRPGRSHHQRSGARGRSASRSEAGFAAELNPITRVILLNVRADLGFRRQECSACRASRHRQGRACRRRFTAAPPCRSRCLRRPERRAICPTSRSPTTPSSPSSFWRNRASVRTSRRRSALPRPMASSRAITTSRAPSCRCGRRSASTPTLQVIEYAKYFELNRGNKLPEATLYSWDNATGDPEIFAGYMLNPKMPFSPWKDEDIGNRTLALFNVADYDKTHCRLPRIGTLRGRERRQHAAVAERADAGAQEEPHLHQIRQRLGAAADATVELMLGRAAKEDCSSWFVIPEVKRGEAVRNP